MGEYLLFGHTCGLVVLFGIFSRFQDYVPEPCRYSDILL
jgi:hypothetical protein